MPFEKFLKEAAPLLGLQWRSFRRRGIKRKVERRIAETGLSSFEEYLLWVKKNPEEQKHLSQILTVTISRFFRDREVFDTIETSLLPTILRKKNGGEFRIWSVGCASGEEPYSLLLLWKERFERNWPQIHLSILATDINENLLERAKEGRYKRSSLREMPESIVASFFRTEKGFYVIDRAIQEGVQFGTHDVIRERPFLEMDIVFCRNSAFTYFSKGQQIDALKKVFLSLRVGGYLVIGRDESLPLTYPTLFIPAFPKERIFKKFGPEFS